MTTTGARLRYGAVTQFFHWLTVILVLAAYFTAEGGPESRVYAADRASSLALHETLGLVVLVVLVLRLLWRAVDRAPEEPPMPGCMLLAARLTQWVLYALLFLVPVTAIVGAWYEGHPVTALWLGEIGPYLGVSADFGRTVTELHQLLGDVILYVAGLHAAAALFHHFVLRDRVLKSMLPGREA
jgi:cytochrome b561